MQKSLPGYGTRLHRSSDVSEVKRHKPCIKQAYGLTPMVKSVGGLNKTRLYDCS